MGTKSRGVEGKVAKPWRIPEGTQITGCPKCEAACWYIDTGRGNKVLIDLETKIGHWHLCPARAKEREAKAKAKAEKGRPHGRG